MVAIALNWLNGFWNSALFTLESFWILAGLPEIVGLPFVLTVPLVRMPPLSGAVPHPDHPVGVVLLPMMLALPPTDTLPLAVTAAPTPGFTVTVRSTIASDWVVPFRVPTDLSRNRLLLSREMVTLKYVPFATESCAMVLLASVASELL